MGALFAYFSTPATCSACSSAHCVTTAECAEKIQTRNQDRRRCSRLRLVVLSLRDGIDEGYNQTHKLGGFAEILRVTFSGRYRSDGLDGPL